MKKLLQSLFILLFVATSAIAQNRTITGTVTSKEDGLPIPGVSVKVKGSNIGVSTGANGKFSLSVPSSATALEFSSIGFATQSVSIGAGNVVNASLVADSKQLSEVLITGALGIKRQPRSLGYSTAVVDAEQLTTARATNVLNAMAGKAAGVRVTSQSGTLGGSSKIVIRGVNSLDGSNPLFVIDGLTVTDGTSAGGTTANNVDYGNRIGDLSSDDIESMTILKGAAATALYGSRAKDGAIIIVTKRGDKNSKSSISFNSSARFDNPLVLPDFQNEYAQGNYNTTTNKYEYGLKYSNGWGPKISESQGVTYPNFLGQQVTLTAYPNNVKDFFETGTSYTNNVAVAGGGDNSDYRLSFTAVNEKGIIPQSKLGKYNFSVNAGRDFGQKISSRFVGTYSRINADGRPAQSSNNTNIITSAIYGLPRVVDINQVRDNVVDPTTGSQIFLTTDKTGNNPYWIMNYNRNSNTVDRFYGTYTLTYKPLDWVTVSNNLGGDIYTEKRSTVTRKGTAGTINGAFANTDIFQRQINNDFLVTLDQANLVKDFKFKLVVGGNINERSSQSTVVSATDLTIDQLYNYSNAVKSVPVLGYSKKRSVSALAALSVNYKDFLYLDVTGRNDWSSTLPINTRSYFYPSVSGSFVFTELLKDKNMNWLSFGKLRASWASVGSDLGPYGLDFQYSPVSTVFMQYVGASTSIFPIGPISTAFTGPRTLPNADLKPQKANSYELGTELKFLNSRIGLDFSYYNTRTTNQLISLDVAISTGYFAKMVNVGALKNSGIELALNLVPVKVKDFQWSLTANYSKNKQIVEELAPGLTQYSLASGWSGLQIKAEVGKPFGLYGSAWERDPAGNYVIDQASGLKRVVANQNLGNIYPDWMLGINNEFRYKNFVLSGLIDIRQGGVFYSGTVASLRSSGLAIETGGDRTPIVDKGVNLVSGAYVTNTTPVKSMQAYWGNQAKVDNTEGNVFNASYVKLREVRFAYAFPRSFFKKASVFKSAELGIEGRNLWLIKSHVPHVDPEANFFGAGSIGEGVEFNSVPSTRSLGVNLRFSF